MSSFLTAFRTDRTDVLVGYPFYNRLSVLSKNYRLIVVLQKFDVLEAKVAREVKLRGQIC